MGQRIVVDPITRIEGHLKIEVEVENGKVKNAWSSGTMARGFEALLTGKDPRDASYVTSRFCGVCFSVHTMASVAALDDAFGAEVPDGGRILRNLVMGAEYLYDHVVHFYQLSALDYLDIMAVARYNGSDKELLAVKDKIVGLVKRGDTYPLTPRYEPDQFSVNDPEIVTMAVKHYLDALKVQVTARNMGAIFGGRAPHYQSIVVGGITQMPDADLIIKFKTMLEEVTAFIKNVYMKDVLLFGTGPLLPLAQAGIGGGHLNYLAYGAFPEDSTGKALFLKPGVIRNGNLGKVEPFDQKLITESVKHAWYKPNEPVHPSDGEQIFDLGKKDAYSFVKAPRYENMPMEVGPLARMLIMKEPNLMGLITNHGVKPGAVARHAARMLETVMMADRMQVWLGQLIELAGKPGFRIHDSAHYEPPVSAEGSGFYEAPRGALGHWIRIKDKKIANYQAVVPSTWNASPRDEKGQRGQYEESLIGVPIPDPENPINIVRVIRSFDPCLACAVHVIHPRTNEILKFRVE
ncbi:MAG: nickel-dependent hydrogenase large subunit [Deltaproteobacteria bacterium]|nr:nickel-dependent hydrogenase large subunit [Deltaproteobacteria bacterium]